MTINTTKTDKATGAEIWTAQAVPSHRGPWGGGPVERAGPPTMCSAENEPIASYVDCHLGNTSVLKEELMVK